MAAQCFLTNLKLQIENLEVPFIINNNINNILICFIDPWPQCVTTVQVVLSPSHILNFFQDIWLWSCLCGPGDCLLKKKPPVMCSFSQI